MGDEPPRPPFDIALIAMCLLALLVGAGVLIALVVFVRCTFAFVDYCNREFGFHEAFLELIIVLVALITRRGQT